MQKQETLRSSSSRSSPTPNRTISSRLSAFLACDHGRKCDSDRGTRIQVRLASSIIFSCLMILFVSYFSLKVLSLSHSLPLTCLLGLARTWKELRLRLWKQSPSKTLLRHRSHRLLLDELVRLFLLKISFIVFA